MDVSREQWEELQRLTMSGDASSKEPDDPPEAVTARVRALLGFGLLLCLTEITSVSEKFATSVVDSAKEAPGSVAFTGIRALLFL